MHEVAGLTAGTINEAVGTHDDRLVIFRSLLEQLRPGRLLDLATGHGAFALIAHDLGWEVTAVDARVERMPMTPGISWVQGDVRNFPTEGYDVVTVLGLLYHLEIEAQIDLLRRCSTSLTILDTHVSRRPTSLLEGYLGHHFTEVLEDTRASWGNPVSFWVTEESLYRLLLTSGYSSILKVVPPPVTVDRTFYVATSAAGERLNQFRSGFNDVSQTYRLETQFEGVVGDPTDSAELSVEVSRLRVERDAAVLRFDRLRSRKSVGIALALARPFAPLFRVVRGRDGARRSAPS